MKPCATQNCDRKVEHADQRWCDSCVGIVLRTGRPPVIEARFVPTWMKHLTAKDMTGRIAA